MFPDQEGQPQNPPFGSSPAVAPTENAGLNVAGQQKVAVAMRFLTEALGVYGAMSEQGEKLLGAMKTLAGLARVGDVSPEGEANQLQKAQFQNTQNGNMMAQLKQRMMTGGDQGGGQQPPGPPMQ